VVFVCLIRYIRPLVLGCSSFACKHGVAEDHYTSKLHVIEGRLVPLARMSRSPCFRRMHRTGKRTEEVFQDKLAGYILQGFCILCPSYSPAVS
jgi:hypothetical protein